MKSLYLVMIGWVIASPAAVAAPTWSERDLTRRAAALRRHGATLRGVEALYGLAALQPRLPRGALTRFLRDANRRRLHPLVRDHLRWIALAEARAAGRDGEARRLRRELGLLDHLFVAGPFDNEGGVGTRKRYGPELRPGAPLRTDRSWVGKGVVVRWRQLPPVFPNGTLRPTALLESGSNSVVYLRTDLWARRARIVALRLGTNGAYGIWLNGQLVARRDLRRALRRDQDAIGLRLRKGNNALLVKLATQATGPQAILRVTAARGGPAKDVQCRAPAQGKGGGITVIQPHAKPLVGPPVTTVRAFLEAAVKRRPKDAALLHALTRYHLFRRPDDAREERARQWASKGVALGPPSAASHGLLARCEKTADARRRSLEAALRIDPRDVQSLFALGELHYARSRYHRAETFWRRALRADPGFLPAALQLAELHQLRRLPALARRTLATLAKRYPRRDDVQLALAALDIELGHLPRAQRRLEAHAKRRRTSIATLARLANLARRALKPRRVEHWLRQQIAQRPDWLRPRIALARSLAANGRVQEGLRVIQAANTLAPGVFRLQRALGRIALRGGLRSAARSALQRALAIRPQALEVKRLLAYLDRKGPDPLVKRWAVDGRALARKAWKARPGARDAEVLVDTTAYDVLKSGLARRFKQRLIRIHTRKGVAAWRFHHLDYLPDTQQLEVRVARIIRPDGSEVEARHHDVQMTDPRIRMYYDRRVKVVRFHGLRPGDVVELQTLLADIPASNAFKDYFGTIVPLQIAIPIRRLQVAVSLPAARRIAFNRPKVAGLRHKTTRASGRVLHHWEARNIAAVEPEPQMPGWAETHAHLHISTFQTWREVARWYWGLVKEQFHADAALRTAALAAAKGKRTPREKVEAIYHLVVKKTRYVALAFGMHTYKPYSAPQVFARKFGDCKDKAMLMAVMLKELGIVAHPVLVRTRRGGRLGHQPPSLAAFDHAILYVPSLKLWLDGTAERTGSAEFPWMDQGMVALIIDGRDGRLVQTPVQPATANRTERRLDLQLRPDGSADVVERWIVRGQEARWWRSQFTDPATRKTTYEKIINRVFPRAKVKRITVSDPDDLAKPVRITARYRVPGLASTNGNRVRVDLGLSNTPLTNTYAPLSKRTHPVLFDYPFELQVTLQVRWPAAWRWHAGPQDARLRAGVSTGSPGAEGVQLVKRSRTGIRVTRRLWLRRHHWTVKDYPALRRFWTRVDRAVQRPLQLRKTGGAP